MYLQGMKLRINKVLVTKTDFRAWEEVYNKHIHIFSLKTAKYPKLCLK